MRSIFPNASTVEAALNRDGKYNGIYNFRRYTIYLNNSGYICAQIEGGHFIAAEDVRGAMDKVYQQVTE